MASLTRRRALFGGASLLGIASLAHAQEIVSFGRQPVLNIFVDSVNGSDSNTGSSAAVPIKTISRLMSLMVSGSTVWLARGSYWREQLGALGGSAVGVGVTVYGSGQMPVLDGADVVNPAAWAKTGGLTSVYDLTWTHDVANGSFVSLWENTTRLRWVASAALCDATAGSFYVDICDATATSHVYYHPTGNGNPASNGLTVEMSKRTYGLIAGLNWSVEYVHTRRQLHNDGSLVGSAFGTFRHCLAEDGTKHNMFLAGGLAEDCIAWLSDWADRTNTAAYVAYVSDGTGQTATFRRCISKMDAAKVAAAVTGGTGLDAFTAHTADTSHNWQSVIFEDCAVHGAVTGFSVANCNSQVMTRCYTEETHYALSGAADTITVTDPWVRDTVGSLVPMAAAYVSYGGNATIQGLRSYSLIASNFGDIYQGDPGTTVTVSKSVLVRASGQSGGRFIVNGNLAGTVINSDHNIIVGGSADTGFRMKGTGSADFNDYSTNSMVFEVASSYSTFAAYQAAQPTLDVHSIAQNPLLNDPANGDFGVSLSSPAIALGAGLERPNITYTAIPSDAALAAM